MRSQNLIGHDVKLVCLTDSPLSKRIEKHQIPFHGLASFGLSAILKAKKILDEYSPDVIVTYGGQETILFGLASAKKIPVVRVRGYSYTETNPLLQKMHDAGLPGVKRIVVPSHELKNQISQFSDIPVSAIQLGIDQEKFFFCPSKWESKRYIDLLIFGRIDPVKGHREFIEVFAHLKQFWKKYRTTDLPLRLKIIGEPANLSFVHLEKSAKDFNLSIGEDVVLVNERVAHIEELMSETTLGVVSSVGSEIICRVAQEFLMSGTPIAVSGVGSLDETLLDPSFGLSYRNLNPEQIALNVCKYLSEVSMESAEARAKRSEIASKYMNFQAMGKAWNSALSFE
ncbi:MAG: glycosyltransferase family 4 protein [Proteobacteria bacterium]|nr:glycosyltransferase family 4 protein [Pseudomonadota bacterium]